MARYISLAQGKGFQMGKGDSKRLVSPEIGASQITMNYSVFQPGQEFPQHFHDQSADIFIVLNGGVSVRQGDQYTPITVGDFAYIPPGEVHGTVNQTDAQATLISFQSPPDLVMYRGERDPAVTGVVPKPPEGHESKVQIRQLTGSKAETAAGVRAYTGASPESGAAEMVLNYYELDPAGHLAVAASPQAEGVWFVWSGDVSLEANGETIALQPHSVAFVPPGEAQQITNVGNEVARLIRCQSNPV